MQFKNTMLGMLALSAIILATIPATEAQTVPVCAQDIANAQIVLKSKGFSAGESNVKPITGLSTAKFTFTYSSDTQARTITQIPITIAHAADVPWLTTSVGTSKTFITLDPSSNSGGSQDFEVSVDVTASDQAPAFAKGNVKVTVSGGPGTCVKAAPPTEGSQQIVAGFYENYQARFQTAIWKTGQNERIQIPLIINNFGNGAIKVQLSPAEGTSSSLNFALPGLQTVESLIAGGSTNEVQIPIDLQTPFKNGYENRRDQFNLEVTGYYFADTNQKLTPVPLQAVIQTQGVYVPGFDVVAMLGAVIGAAFLARLRK